jgi:hypothetical protein
VINCVALVDEIWENSGIFHRIMEKQRGDFRTVGRKGAKSSSSVKGFLVQSSTGIGRRLGHMLGDIYLEKVR